MIHLDLFSGIGGAALAVDTVWPGSEHTFVEIDKYCQALLKLRFPNSQIHGDIRTFRFNPDPDSDGRADRQEKEYPTEGGKQAFDGTKGCSCHCHIESCWCPEQWDCKHCKPTSSNTDSRRQAKQEQQTAGNKQCDRRIDILTGGFPCQPFSQAGRRKGTADNRYLWPEMLRVIRECKPQWVIGENVAGLLTWDEGVVLEQVCLDLEAEGYEVENFVIPAVAVNAPHRRDRIWIVAHTTSERWNNGFDNRKERHVSADERIAAQSKPEWQGRERGIGEIGADASNARQSYGTRSSEKLEANKTEWSARKFSFERGSSWNENWVEVATKFCGMDDGLPARMDGFKLSKSKHRAERLKGLGNAWVPAVAEQIMKVIKEIDPSL